MKKASWFPFLIACVIISLSARAADQEGGPSFGAFVLEGTPTASGSDISKAMLLVSISGGTCSGVAISRRHILTAGHCVVKKPSVGNIRILAGTKKRPQGRVKSYKLHPRYAWENDRVRADLSVIEMVGDLDSQVVPVSLASAELVKGAKLEVAGFGYSDPQRTKKDRLLQTSFEFGRSASLLPQKFSDGSRLLFMSGRHSLCQGDSGGATFRRTSKGLSVVGIHSMSNCESRSFDVYTLDYRAWVLAMSSL